MAHSTHPPEDQEPAHAATELLPVVYDNLRRLAAKLLGQKAGTNTLQATALVHEAFIRLTKSKDSPVWENPDHFFAAAAKTMRRILVDSHRRKEVFHRLVAEGHVGAQHESSDPPLVDLIALDDALNQLEAEDSVAAQIVEYRFFAGLTMEQTAAALQLSRRAVSDKWSFARAWLLLMLEGKTGDNSHWTGMLTAVHS